MGEGSRGSCWQYGSCWAAWCCITTGLIIDGRKIERMKEARRERVNGRRWRPPLADLREYSLEKGMPKWLPVRTWALGNTRPRWDEEDGGGTGGAMGAVNGHVPTRTHARTFDAHVVWLDKMPANCENACIKNRGQGKFYLKPKPIHKMNAESVCTW